MHRRSFLGSLVQRSVRKERAYQEAYVQPLANALEPYALPLNLQDSYHLLRRAGFSPTVSSAKALVSKSAADAFDIVLGTGLEPAPDAPGTWIDDTQYDPKTLPIGPRFQVLSAWANTYISMMNWWVERMRLDEQMGREKLTLFWKMRKDAA